eukprot:CAMPEP_0181268440 /NCGR_PEP_ID=MMETSP1097-20121128/5525_1 /TAXON_ID=35684 /ORGANISM="Pseudopedinella elastica, Strain CCMP716" /LENGTH=126 /DNA_ID=CAMNT_0023368115 /DNA_START=226 /DNA_END=608 /DNA_ORIENTATION=+
MKAPIDVFLFAVFEEVADDARCDGGGGGGGGGGAASLPRRMRESGSVVAETRASSAQTIRKFSARLTSREAISIEFADPIPAASPQVQILPLCASNFSPSVFWHPQLLSRAQAYGTLDASEVSGPS